MKDKKNPLSDIISEWEGRQGPPSDESDYDSDEDTTSRVTKV